MKIYYLLIFYNNLKIATWNICKINQLFQKNYHRLKGKINKNNYKLINNMKSKLSIINYINRLLKKQSFESF